MRFPNHEFSAQSRSVRLGENGDQRSQHVLMDHAPDLFPVCHVPLTIQRMPLSKRSPSGAPGLRSTLDVHVPANSPFRPVTTALHAPFHLVGDFAADHAPPMIVLPCPSTIAHV